MSTNQPSERHRGIAWEIAESLAAYMNFHPEKVTGQIAAILAKHDRPATAPERTNEEIAAPPAEGREGELRRILDDIRVAARVENRALRLKSIDDLVAAALTPEGTNAITDEPFTQPHPSDQPNGGPGVYECRHATFRNRMWCWWNGTNLFLYRTPEGEGWNMVVTADYTDFRGPLTVQPEGWGELMEAARASLLARIHFEGNPEGALDEIDHRLRAALAKLDTVNTNHERKPQ